MVFQNSQMNTSGISSGMMVDTSATTGVTVNLYQQGVDFLEKLIQATLVILQMER